MTPADYSRTRTHTVGRRLRAAPHSGERGNPRIDIDRLRGVYVLIIQRRATPLDIDGAGGEGSHDSAAILLNRS